MIYLYDRLLALAMTGFVFNQPPTILYRPDERNLEPEPLPDTEIFERLPFPCIRIRVVNDYSGYSKAKGRFATSHVTDDVVIRSNGKSYEWAARERVVWDDGVISTRHAPEQELQGTTNLVLKVVVNRLELLELETDWRFIEQPMSRPLRRSENLPPEYCEYIVVNRADRSNGIRGKMLTLAKVMRRHPMLHAVRGHLRHLRSGRITFVRSHVRGEGDLVQAKEYRVYGDPTV